MRQITDQSSFRLQRIPLSSLSEQVVLALEEAILLGKLKPGQRIVEAEVAAQLGISNGPVREALRELENLGLVVCAPRRGTFVTEFTVQIAREVFSLRALLEVAALRLLLPNLTDDDVRRLEVAIERMGSSLKEPGRTTDLPEDDDIQFHDLLFELSGHRLLQQAWLRLRSQARVLLVVTGTLANAATIPISRRIEDYRAVHKPILEAIQARDLDRAERAVIHHLAEGERHIVNRLAMTNDETQPLVRQILKKEGGVLPVSLA